MWQNAVCANGPAARGLRSMSGAPGVVETELAVPTSWPLHVLPYLTATGCPSSPQKQGPAWALWVLPSRLASSLQPSSRHLRDWRATLPLQPLTGPWVQTHPVDLSGLYQAVDMCEKGSLSPGESLGR